MESLKTLDTISQEELGLQLDPNHFMEFLKAEDQDIEGNYEIDCVGMCEFACLYIGMMLTDSELPGKLSLVSGKAGWGGHFWVEHFWVEYTLEGQTYIIDLTLRQFIPEATNLIVSKSRGSVYKSYTKSGQGQPMTEYLEQVKAFEFYIDPRTMTKPVGHMTEKQILSILRSKFIS